MVRSSRPFLQCGRRAVAAARLQDRAGLQSVQTIAGWLVGGVLIGLVLLATYVLVLRAALVVIPIVAALVIAGLALAWYSRLVQSATTA